MKNKRRFQRIAFEHDAKLTIGDSQWPVQLLDLSLKGILCSEPVNFPDKINAPIFFELILDQEHVITLQANLSHRRDGLLGLSCNHIDLDSISELKKILQLNLGNDQLLHRELEQLAGID